MYDTSIDLFRVAFPCPTLAGMNTPREVRLEFATCYQRQSQLPFGAVPDSLTALYVVLTQAQRTVCGIVYCYSYMSKPCPTLFGRLVVRLVSRHGKKDD
jgi:hypothetical protein